MATVRKTFTFDDKEHAHLLRWLDRQPNASEAVRDALEAAVSDDVTLSDVLREIEALGSRLGTLGSLPAEVEDLHHEDEALAALVDGLGM